MVGRTNDGHPESRLELLWDATYRPAPFDHAPLLISNDTPPNNTDFPAVQHLVAGANRTTPCGQLASRIRASKQAVPDLLAAQIAASFATQASQTQSYFEAVMSRNHKWAHHAEEERWADLQQRRRRYEELAF